MNHLPTLIFAQVYSPNKAIYGLNKKILEKFSLKEKFGFVPHISTTFFKNNPSNLFKEIEKRYRDYSFEEFSVNEIEFMEWDLHPKKGLSKPRLLKSLKLK
ncbi:hypothetical protein KAJ87_01775 [Candidatus Pacearchaeota archaeon]|nr:hypothetical protein [Candidatus Pacearchaeota archaeon]